MTIRNKYEFCGCKIELESDEPILKESTFSLFKSDFEKADYFLSIKKVHSLPPKSGVCISYASRREIYLNNGKYSYTAYYSVPQSGYVDFACKVNEDTLYISYPDNLREVTVFDALDLPSMLLQKGTGIMHCSFIEYEGQAILFAGNKQVGKSTQAALWEEYMNAEIINGDRAGLFVENDKIYACGVPFCGTSGICKNNKYPLKAIVCPSKSNVNAINKMSPIEAFAGLLGKFTYDCSDKDSVEAVTALAMRIAESIPVYDFKCLKDETAVSFLKSNILE